MAEPKLSGRQIMEMFYTEEPAAAGGDGAAAEGKVSFRCRCGKVRAQSLKHGYTNLKQHVALKHPEWLAALREEGAVGPAVAVAARPAAAAAKKSRTAKQQQKQEPAAPVMVAGATATGSDTAAPLVLTPEVATVHKRTDYLSWDDYFMSVAFLSAMRSKGA